MCLLRGRGSAHNDRGKELLRQERLLCHAELRLRWEPDDNSIRRLRRGRDCRSQSGLLREDDGRERLQAQRRRVARNWPGVGRCQAAWVQNIFEEVGVRRKGIEEERGRKSPCSDSELADTREQMIISRRG